MDYENWYDLYFSNYPNIGNAVFLCYLLFLFYALGNTADAYFTPTLYRLSLLLKLPMHIAGITLLAFGNGAPDVFSSIVAFNVNAKDTAINELLGAGVFVTTFVVGAVGYTSTLTLIRIDKRQTGRDVLVYAIAILYFMYIGQLKSLSVWMVLALPMLYIGYVLYILASRDDAVPGVNVIDGKMNFHMDHDEVNSGWYRQKELLQPILPVESYFENRSDKTQMLDGSMWMANWSSKSNTSVKVLMNKYWYWKQESMKKVYRTWPSNKNWAVKLGFIVELPITIGRSITIPLLDDWSRSRAIWFPIACPLIVLAAFEMLDYRVDIKIAPVPLWMITVAIGCVGAIFTYCFTHSSKPPKQWCTCFILVLTAFFTCIIWIYVIAAQILDVLVLLGKNTGVSKSIMGFTILAWGNSVGDLITNVAVAKAGFPDMAIAGCIGGPMFNLLLGAGIPLIKEAVYNGSAAIQLDHHAIISIGTLLLSLPITMLYLYCHDYVLTKRFSIALMFLYFAYSISNIIQAHLGG